MHSYIIKVVCDSIFIYELAYSNNLIRINVFGMEEILETFPRQIMMNQQIFDRKDVIKEKKREIVKEELRLSTKLNTDSFNYDFHSLQILNLILFTDKKKKDFNVS